jgi:hypothetical protein
MQDAAVNRGVLVWALVRTARGVGLRAVLGDVTMLLALEAKTLALELFTLLLRGVGANTSSDGLVGRLGSAEKRLEYCVAVEGEVGDVHRRGTGARVGDGALARRGGGGGVDATIQSGAFRSQSDRGVEGRWLAANDILALEGLQTFREEMNAVHLIAVGKVAVEFNGAQTVIFNRSGVLEGVKLRPGVFRLILDSVIREDGVTKVGEGGVAGGDLVLILLLLGAPPLADGSAEVAGDELDHLGRGQEAVPPRGQHEALDLVEPGAQSLRIAAVDGVQTRKTKFGRERQACGCSGTRGRVSRGGMSGDGRLGLGLSGGEPGKHRLKHRGQLIQSILGLLGLRHKLRHSRIRLNGLGLWRGIGGVVHSCWAFTHSAKV